MFISEQEEKDIMQQVAATMMQNGVSATDLRTKFGAAIKQAKDNAKESKKQAELQKKQQKVAAANAMYEPFNLTLDESGEIVKMSQNYINLMTLCTDFQEIRLNDFSGLMMYGDHIMDKFDFSRIRNTISNMTMGRLHSKDDVEDAINQIGQDNKFNEVLDFLESLEGKWDGVPRVEKMFHTFMGAEDCELYSAMAKKWMVAAVKRAYEPGCKFDNMIILQGPMGIGKSNFCEKLAVRPDWFCPNVILGDKDGLLQVASSWIVNMDELSSYTRKDSATAKSFITMTFDQFRSPYGHFTQTVKRHCVFIGSTNEESFLKDETSIVERRYWVVKCSGTVDDSVQRFKAMTPELVAQLWAEARYYYKSGYDELYISGAMYKQFELDQRQYKNCNDSLLFNFLDVALDKPYADFEPDDDKSLPDQYLHPDLYNNRTKKVQDFFPITALSKLCRENHYDIYRGHGFAQFAVWSGKFRYGTKYTPTKNIKGLIRITKEERSEEPANINLDELFA